MNSSTENMMMYLVGFIVVLILAIAIPITISILKKKKPTELAKSTEPELKKETLVQTEIVIEEKKIVQVVPEKEREKSFSTHIKI